MAEHKAWNVWDAIDRQGDAAYLQQQAKQAELERLIQERSGGVSEPVPVPEPSWQSAVADVLADPHVSYHRSYYPAGELTDEPVAITVTRISQSDYDLLAGGSHDYVSSVQPNEPETDEIR